MQTLGESPFTWLEFDQHGSIVSQEIDDLNSLLKGPGITDLIIISHGWKNDKNDAFALYQALWINTCNHLPAGTASSAVVAGVLWPAKTYRTDFDETALVDSGGSTALSSGRPGGQVGDLDGSLFEQVIADFQELFGMDGDSVAKTARLAAEGLNGAAALSLLKRAVKAGGINAPGVDPELKQDGKRIAKAQNSATEAQLVLESLITPPTFKINKTVGSAQGLGDIVSGLVAGPRAAVARFLNQLTYYEMKKRAGIVGLNLANKAISALEPAHPIRLHLVGHSFGARLVSAAANAIGLPAKVNFSSLTLLQAAFSHNGFAETIEAGVSGAFPKVVGKPTGPISITHTHNDLACTLAYAIASRLSRDMTQGVGDKNDKFGAMGANGPQHLAPSLVEPDDTNQAFKPKPGKLNTFLADKFIVKTDKTDAHNNVANAEVGRLLAATLTTK